MKLTIVDEELFINSNAYFSNFSYLGNEYEVYAFYSSGVFKKKGAYLILLDGDYLQWCHANKSVKVTGDLNKNWVFVPKFKRVFEKEMCAIVFKNLYCYKWMIENEKFLLDIYENNGLATLLLKEQFNLI